MRSKSLVPIGRTIKNRNRKGDRFYMPAQWTGDVVGQMHIHNITRKTLAAELGWHEKYLIRVLNSADPPRMAEQKVRAALSRLLSREHQQ